MEKVIRTYCIGIKPTDFIWELSKEAGRVYSFALTEFWKQVNDNNYWLSKFKLQDHLKDKIERTNLHSDSYLAAMQQVHANLESWKQAKKVKPDTKPPTKFKFIQPIQFKKSQIRFANRKLIFSLGKNNNGEKEYFSIIWNVKLPLPVHASITYDKFTGWKLNMNLEIDVHENKLIDIDKFLSIDLGVKRICTIYDGEKCTTLSGKKLMSLLHYQNKIKAKTQSKLSLKQKDSNNYKKLKRAGRKKNDRLQNIKREYVHKVSNFIIDYATKNNIGNIIIGDNSGTHQKGVEHKNKKTEKRNNQKINQFIEQRVKNTIKYKFESISGQVDIVSEAYTSKRCPCCKQLNEPKNRMYSCSSCSYVYDRDGVGAINIYIENIKKISFDDLFIGRIRSMTLPYGVRLGNLTFHNKLLAEKTPSGNPKIQIAV